MKRRVSLPVESFDGHTPPGASWGGTYLGDLGNPVLTHKPGAAGDGIQVLSSKWVTSPGRNAKRGIKPFASKQTANGEIG
jgi:hypothetical protein